jgi:hypothetical protein
LEAIVSGLKNVRVKLALCGLSAALSLCVAENASAQARPEPTPEQVQAAAEAFDHGRDAYKAGRYGEAAEQFERADANAPSSTALELAIKARDKAGELDRAATLALLAVELYASEVQSEETGLGKIAPSILERARQELYELDVQCSEACELVDGRKLVHGEAMTQRAIFLSPGDHTLIAGWSEGRTQQKTVTATAGASGELAFEAPPIPEKPAAQPEPADTPPADPVDEAPKESGGWSPTVFFVGVGLTAAAGGVTVWSGIDTKNNPGPEAVTNGCDAGDTECDLYEKGRSKQLRTNILIGVTSGLAVATGLVGAFAIDWGSGGSAHDTKAARRKIQPVLGWSHGPKLGARGTF